jgi:putative FmdB family regulatory protein
MPIYEYQCRACGKQLEVLVRRKSDVPSKCPACGTGKLQKIFSTFAVATPDPSAHCESCPTAASSCSGGSCRTGACPFSADE